MNKFLILFLKVIVLHFPWIIGKSLRMIFPVVTSSFLFNSLFIITALVYYTLFMIIGISLYQHKEVRGITTEEYCKEFRLNFLRTPIKFLDKWIYPWLYGP